MPKRIKVNAKRQIMRDGEYLKKGLLDMIKFDNPSSREYNKKTADYTFHKCQLALINSPDTSTGPSYIESLAELLTNQIIQKTSENVIKKIDYLASLALENITNLWLVMDDAMTLNPISKLVNALIRTNQSKELFPDLDAQALYLIDYINGEKPYMIDNVYKGGTYNHHIFHLWCQLHQLINAINPISEITLATSYLSEDNYSQTIKILQSIPDGTLNTNNEVSDFLFLIRLIHQSPYSSTNTQYTSWVIKNLLVKISPKYIEKKESLKFIKEELNIKIRSNEINYLKNPQKYFLLVPTHNRKKITISESPTTPAQEPMSIEKLVKPFYNHTKTNKNLATTPIGSSKSAFTKIERNTKKTDLEKNSLFNQKKQSLDKKNHPEPKKQKLDQPCRKKRGLDEKNHPEPKKAKI